VKAITLWPEWAHAICKLGKLVENRSWQPGRALAVGDRIAIHAGAHMGGRPGLIARQEARESVRNMLRLQPGLAPRPLWSSEMWPLEHRAMDEVATSAVVAVATVAGFDMEQRTFWDVPGSWHWRLSDVVVFADPIACGGAQGLWTPSPAIQNAIARRLEAA
jgi:hypothetical protein